MGVVLNFDATQVDPRQSKGGVCFPLAEYPCEISNIEAVAVKDQPTKGFLEVTLKVLDGQYKGQEQIDRLNLYGQSETVMKIAYSRLSAYAHIAGKLKVADSSELIGTRVIALIGPQDAPNDKYSEVKQLKDLAGNVPVWGQAAAPQNTPIAAAQPAQTAQSFAGAAQAAPAAAQPWNNPAQQTAPTGPPAPAAQAWATGAVPVAQDNKPPWAK